MKQMDFSDLNRSIDEKKSDVERNLLRTTSSERKIRTRPRDEEEAKILDKLCIQRWKKAESEGKIKYISDRVWYYEFD
ncbi:hypothetical protein CVD25_13710 [Bacillus canaveralius]|uniref:Uncharacterized protein n=1 Tax=Bacillus canaveralius TaxID=1403243 RepID=A0A2N5GL88_9BACI|nr:hypothetical protein CU633_03920 [Bacillus sp. V3-13]PLR82407.1 hypothetical protein CU635_11375 [Bacillus canaveralius]PLR85658.1 hypothetical protein CVD23_08150 [Bacillus sp. V33-4]PLR95578.1 hypothetical protein CVD25_13710 [Bacillus canaveralius]